MKKPYDPNVIDDSEFDKLDKSFNEMSDPTFEEARKVGEREFLKNKGELLEQ